MSFIKNPGSIFTDLTDSKQLKSNLKRIEDDEVLVIKKVKFYDKKIEDIQKKFLKKSKELSAITKKIYKTKPKTKDFRELIKKRDKIRQEQHNLRFKEESSIREKQSELIDYYKDLIKSIKLLKKMKKLKKEQLRKVHKTIVSINKHLKK